VMECERCGWDVIGGNMCSECERVQVFKVAAHIAGQAIMSQPNLLLRLRLVKKFFGVCVNQWETLSMLGSVPCAVKSSVSPLTRKVEGSA